MPTKLFRPTLQQRKALWAAADVKPLVSKYSAYVSRGIYMKGRHCRWLVAMEARTIEKCVRVTTRDRAIADAITELYRDTSIIPYRDKWSYVYTIDIPVACR